MTPYTTNEVLILWEMLESIPEDKASLACLNLKLRMREPGFIKEYLRNINEASWTNFYKKPIKEMPLFINQTTTRNRLTFYAIVAKWRLKIGH